MTQPAFKANPLRKPYKFKTTYMTVNQRMYRWAEELFYEDQLSGSLLHTLKAIIATRHMKQPTIQQINDARTRSAARKFAQSDAVSNRTIRRHIQKLESLKLIVVDRYHKGWDSRNSYTVCVPNEFLVKQREDIVSPSLSCCSPVGGASSKIENNHTGGGGKVASAAPPVAACRATPPPKGGYLGKVFITAEDLANCVGGYPDCIEVIICKDEAEIQRRLAEN